MEESRGGFEVRRIQIVYFLCRNGKIEQPHLIRVHHLNSSGVRLRDVKRWLSELRGKVLPESFAWSYKRRYRGGYLWQDLTDADLITAISDNEYVLKGSLLPSLNKTMDSFFDQNSSQIKELAEETEQQPKTTPETLQMEDNKWSSEEMNSKTSFFGMESIWQKERNRGVDEEQNSSVVVVLEKKEGSGLIRSNSNGNRKARNVMRNFIGCMTVETMGSALRAVGRQDSSMSGSSDGSSSSSSSKSISSSSSIYREKPTTGGRTFKSEASRRSTGSLL